MHYNKQLGIIYGSSRHSYKLIDYHAGEPHDSSKINIELFEYRFSRNVHTEFHKNILYFDNNIILIYSDTTGIVKYDLNKTLYTPKYQQNIVYGHNESYCGTIHNGHIYIQHGCEKYRIEVYELENLNYIKQSCEFNQNALNTIQMTIHDNTIHICEFKSEMLYNILSHDVTTLGLNDNRNFHLDKTHVTMTMYNNMIYTYGQNKIHTYDIKTFNKVYTFDVEPFKNSKPHYTHHISISNDVLMLSNNKEIQIYDV